MPRWTPLAAAVLAAAGLTAAVHAGPHTSGHHPDATLHEVAHTADLIVLGTVVAAENRIAIPGVSAFTDYEIEVDSLIRETATSIGLDDAATTVTVSLAGGRIDDEHGIRLSGVPELELGEQYLMFLLDDGRPYVNPMVGGGQGLFKVVRDPRTGIQYPIAGGGRGIREIIDREVHLTPAIAALEAGVAAIRDADRRVLTAPVSDAPGHVAATVGPAAGVPIMSLAAFLDEVDVLLDMAPPASHERVFRGVRGAPTGETFKPSPPRGVEGAAPVVLQGSEGRGVPRRAHRDLAIDPGAPGHDTRDASRLTELAPINAPHGAVAHAGGDGFCVCGYQPLFQEFELSLNSDFAFWEEVGMAEFNQYVDVFRVRAADGDQGASNSEDELLGLQSEATMNSEYGYSWGTALAVAYSRILIFCDCCEILEVDIAFNPSYSWSFDDDAALNPDQHHYLTVLMHELGHSVGFNTGATCPDETYLFGYGINSVMHGGYSELVENGYGLHPVDARNLRLNYDDQATIPTIVDLGVESYWSDGGLSNATTDVEVVAPGSPITIDRVTVENMSNIAVDDVRVRLMLSTNTIITTSDTPFPGSFYWSSLPAESAWVGTLTGEIPFVPAGEYYVGLIVAQDFVGADPYPLNDASWVLEKIEVLDVTPSNDDVADAIPIGLPATIPYSTEFASTDGFPHEQCQFDGQTYNDIWYSFVAACDGAVTATTCTDLGGSAEYDTDLVIYEVDDFGILTLLGCNDDDEDNPCGAAPIYQSTAIAPVTGGRTYLIRVGGFGETSRGEGVLRVDFRSLANNDAAADAFPLPATEDGTIFFDNRCATSGEGVQAVCASAGGNDVWYRITAPIGGELVVTTCEELGGETEITTFIALYDWDQATTPPSESLIVCNVADPDFPCGVTVITGSTARADVEAGDVILARVGSDFFADRGTGFIRWFFEASCIEDIDDDGEVGFSDLTLVLSMWGISGPSPSADVSGNGVVDFQDLALVLAAWGTCDG